MGRGVLQPRRTHDVGGLRRCAGEGPFDRSSTAGSPTTFGSSRTTTASERYDPRGVGGISCTGRPEEA